MIPKTIHYCWFGGNPLPPLAVKCIKSWKKYCPDYEIVEWNEKNFDVSSAPLYVRQAYEAKKWAFVTDYVRLYAMTTCGGVYMDTDVELVKPIDTYLSHEAFSGFEDNTHIPTGIMACRKDFPLFREFLSYYDTAEFYNPDGTISYVTNVTTITSICLSRGFIPNGEYQEISGLALYPKDFFCPIDFKTKKLMKTKNTVCIHWFSGSWISKELKQKQKKRKRAEKIDWIKHFPHRLGRKLLGDKRYEALKAKLKGN